MSERPKVDALPPIVPDAAAPIQYVESVKSKSIRKWKESYDATDKDRKRKRSRKLKS